MLEFIATRDINEDEEILIDYGERWQKAWDQHVKSWTPVDPLKDYNNYTHLTKPSSGIAGTTMYRRAELYKLEPFRTVEEQKINPYPRNVVIRCHVDLDIGIGNYTHKPITTPFYRRKWVEEDGKKDIKPHNCKITGRKSKRHIIAFDDEKENGPFVYNVNIPRVKKQSKFLIQENHVITRVPAEAIDLVNEKYTSDMFLKSAFRHEMELPDGLWPEAWMNL